VFNGVIMMSVEDELFVKMDKVAEKIGEVLANDDLNTAYDVIVLTKIIVHLLDQLDIYAEKESQRRLFKEFRRKIANEILGVESLR